MPASIRSDRQPTQDQLLQWIEKDLRNWGRWGDDDQKGTLNYLTPEGAKAATDLVQEGATVSCARTISYQHGPDSPRPPMYYMISPGDQYRSGEGVDRQVGMDFFGLIFHGHTITHVDSLAHFFWDGKMYNGFSSMEVTSMDGAKKNSVYPAHGGIVTRGILVDAPLLRGEEIVERGDGVGLDDIEKAEKECGISPRQGDVLLLRTGQLGHRERTGPISPYDQGSAGPLPEILPFIHERGVAVLGSDTGNDVMPTPYKRFSNPVHQVGIVAMGLWILDNAWLDDLAEACRQRNRWEFMISINPLRIPNSTGSPVNPIAVF